MTPALHLTIGFIAGALTLYIFARGLLAAFMLGNKTP